MYQNKSHVLCEISYAEKIGSHWELKFKSLFHEYLMHTLNLEEMGNYLAEMDLNYSCKHYYFLLCSCKSPRLTVKMYQLVCFSRKLHKRRY